MIMNQNSTKLKDFICIIIVLLLFVAQIFLNQRIQKPVLTVSKQEAVLNLNENVFRFFSLGQQRLISSLIWVHTLIESDIEHYKNDDLNSWMYLRFNSITLLDPYFYDAYFVGGKYLSVVKDDVLGAMEIFEKGLITFPTDYWLRFYNGFNYFFELDDRTNAILNYEIAAQSPLARQHSPYLPSLLAKLKASAESPEEAFLLLLRLYELEPEESHVRPHQEKTLYALRAEIDLGCLNNAQNSINPCRKIDFRGNPYLKSASGVYFARDEWEVARLKKRQRKAPSEEGAQE